MIDKLAELYESVNIMIREFEPSLQSQDRMINNLERQAEIKDKYIQLLMDREAENDKEINRLRGLVGELSGGMLSGFPDVETSA
jgi:hypothetical protein